MTRPQEFTSSEVALMLNVSGDFVLRLIESGALPATQVDGGWLVDADVLAAFKRKRDADRRDGLRELTQLTEDFGGYERER